MRWWVSGVGNEVGILVGVEDIREGEDIVCEVIMLDALRLLSCARRWDVLRGSGKQPLSLCRSRASCSNHNLFRETLVPGQLSPIPQSPTAHVPTGSGLVENRILSLTISTISSSS